MSKKKIKNSLDRYIKKQERGSMTKKQWIAYCERRAKKNEKAK